MAGIRVTPEELNSQGGDLIGYAGQLSEVLQEIDKKINEIGSEWEGLAQDAYFDMYTTMKESLNQFPTLVESLGQATQGAAKAFSTVDSELQSGFQSA